MNQKPKIILITLLSLSIIISFYASISSYSMIGLGYDEALFINAAILKDNYTYIQNQIIGIPLMIMGYIGALKSWLYIPIFKVFGVNIFSIRLPMLLLLYVNLFLIYKILIKYFNIKVVLTLLILLVTDITFVGLHVIDTGPNAIETFIKFLCLYLLTKKINYKIITSIAILLFLGIFNKLNFIWFINALYGLLIFQNWRNFLQFNKKELLKNYFPIFSFIYLSLLIYLIYILHLDHIKSEFPLEFEHILEQISSQSNVFLNTLNDYTFELYFGWSSPHLYISIFFKFIIAIVLIINFWWFLSKKIGENYPHLLNLIFTSLIFIQIIFTKEATHPWHILVCYPFFQLLLINTVFLFSKRNNISVEIILPIIAVFYFSYNLRINSKFWNKLHNECSEWKFEPKINDLIAFTKSRNETKIYSLGWGIHNQLLAFDVKSNKYLEFICRNYKINFENTVRSNPDMFNNYDTILLEEYVLGGSPEGSIHLHAMEKLAAKNDLELKLIKTIKDHCQRTLYTIYKLHKIDKNIFTKIKKI